MLHIVMILLVASNALVYSTHLGYNERPVSSALIERVFVSNVDDKDLSSYIVDAVQLIINFGNLGDSASQVITAAQTIGVLIKLVDGIPSTICYSAALINAVAERNETAIQKALYQYIDVINEGIDHIVQRIENPTEARYAGGEIINCTTGGRVYDFEGAWDIILANSNSNNERILRKEYRIAELLYQAFSILTNTVGAAVTATALPPVTMIFQKAIGPIAVFIRAIATVTCDLTDAAANAKAALVQALNSLYRQA